MGTVYDVKGKAKNLIAKWLDIPTEANNNGATSGTPTTSSSTTPYRPETNNIELIKPMQSLSLGDNGYNRPGAPFVGGFNPNAPHNQSSSIPRPPPMPIPQANPPRKTSLTMQYAIGSPDSSGPNSSLLTPNFPAGSPPSRPNSVPYFPKPVFASPYPSAPSTPAHGAQNNNNQISPSPNKAGSPNAGKKPKRPRATSTPPSPSSNSAGASGQIQCSGVTKAGKRCTRLVKNGPALTGILDSDGQTIERFCFQHQKEILIPTGFYAKSRNGGEQPWISFTDWIPDYLHPDTQVALRVEMEKPRSSSDTEGYIYTFEIRDPNNTETIKLKVGRAVNVVKRLDQWGKQCGSKEQVLRGWYPGTVDPDDDDDDVGPSLMRGRVRAGGKGVWCHRLERLIHLELADLAINEAYLKPGWKSFRKGKGKGEEQDNGTSSNSGSSSPTASPSAKKGKGKNAAGVFTNGLGNGGGLCKDCGSMHKEIFEFARFKKGPHKGKEWEDVVQTVIDDWGKFVSDYL